MTTRAPRVKSNTEGCLMRFDRLFQHFHDTIGVDYGNFGNLPNGEVKVFNICWVVC